MSGPGRSGRSDGPRAPTFLRPRDGRLLGGVCAALARRIGQDAVALRVAWSLPVALFAPFLGWWLARGRDLEALPFAGRWCTLLTGALAAAAIAAYLLAWLLIPEE